MERLNVGVIGIGRIARDHLKGLAQVESARIFALSSRNRDAVTKAAEEYHAEVFYQDYRELLANGDVHAVMICTPNRLHYPMALEALAAGKHVFLEKPMAESLADARDVVQKAKSRGLSVSVCYLSRYMPIFAEAKKLVASGALGKPLALVGRRFWHRETFPEWWKEEKHLAIPHFGSHSLDLGVWYLGGRGKRVYAEGTPAKGAFPGESEYALVARMTTGAVISLELSMSCRNPQFDHVIIGESATATVDGVTRIVVNGKTHFEIGEDECYQRGFRDEVAEFVSAVLEGRAALTSAEESTKSMELVEGAVESAESGRAVTL